MPYGVTDLSRIRNFGIIAHIDAGKTTTTERILYYTRRIHRIGNVDEGTTTTDWYEEEQRRGISIFSAATTCEWKGHHINLIDTPGHVDFTAEVERSLRVLDGAVVVFDAVNGVEAQSETVWRQAARYGIPRLAYVNKMDRPGAHYERCLESMRQKLGAVCAPVVIPWGIGSAFHGVIDLVTMKGLIFEGETGEEVISRDLPEEVHVEAERVRSRLLETVAEFDDEALGKFLDGHVVDEISLRRAVRAGTLANKVVPVYAGSSLHHQGVQPILDGVLDYLPSPLDRPEVRGHELGSDRFLTRDFRKDPSLAALAFKTETDKHGELTYVRVYSGTLRTGDALYNPREGRVERATRLFRMFAHDRESLDSAGPGEIAAVVGLKHTVTGDTLCDRRAPILLERPLFAEPVISLAIEPKSSADKDKLDEVLKRLSRDDPTFKVTSDPETGQTLLHCMGELHAEILLHRITHDFNISAKVGDPRVAYKETISGATEANEEAAIRAGEKVLFGHVEMTIAPQRERIPPQILFDLTSEGEKTLKRFIPAIREGAQSAFESGPVAGFPLIYLDCIITGGRVTAESAEPAYSAAAQQAFRKALSKVQGVILEPHMTFEVITPEEYVGDVLNDLNRRGALISALEGTENAKRIAGHVPLSKMFGYATTLRSLTQGRGSYTMEPFEYRPIPAGELRKKFGDFLS